MLQSSSLQLWQQYKMGDPEAFSRLYSAYVMVLYAQGLRMTPNAALVKDCIHDLFVELWRNRQRVPEPNSVSLYLEEALRAGLEAKLKKQARPATMEEPSLLPQEAMPSVHHPMPRLQPVTVWPVQLPVGQPEVMSLPGYGEVASQTADAGPLLLRAIKALQGMLSLR